MRILFGVLNWGLGHASRSLSIIHHLQDSGHECYIASDGAALNFLKENLNNEKTKFIPFPSYHIRYDKKRVLTSVLRKIIPMTKGIKREYSLTQRLTKELEIDVIISDNRLGVYSRKCPSIYISHQLRIFTGLRFLDPMANLIYGNFIRPFDQIWVPDFEGSVLSGALSLRHHGNKKYIGSLSTHKNEDGSQDKEEIEQILIILSGPEPKRTEWEHKLIGQLRDMKNADYHIVLVRGLPEAKDKIDLKGKNIEVHNFLSKKMLSKELSRTGLLISRAGYSTIMDLSRLKLKAILVPTPGQPEQEYLSQYLKGKIPCLFVSESELDLANFQDKLEDIDKLKYPEASKDSQTQYIDELMANLIAVHHSN